MDFKLVRNDTIGIEVGKVDEAVKIAAENLKNDILKAVGVKISDASKVKIHINTIPSTVEKPETFELKVENGELFISGTDRRGTVYGIYTLSEMLGVSPWYYFADVPVKEKDEFILPEGYVLKDAPTVPYRGIFINDEEELDKWARLHMDEPTIGIHTYEKIFELLLRLKGNYIWPAMHVNSFNMQPESGALASRMGVVVGTSHCDMLMRSNFREWEPWTAKKGYKDAEYDYSIEGRNRDILKEYWRESVEQNSGFEVSYTLGMRGIHDSGFVTSAYKDYKGEELLQKKKELLEMVIRDQKDILDKTLGRKTLMTFVPYKEVLNLYDRGLEIPEDITLIWTNDNYGYIRRYPSEKEQNRAGGNGIYYHNSYWSPTLRHYLFISSNPIAKIRYEMGKAYENGIKKLWVCNMGALKPLEQEMEYFIKLGWDYGKPGTDVDDPDKYLAGWIDKNFSGNHGRETAEILNAYAQLTDVRKVEHMEEDVFSEDSYNNEAAIHLNSLRKLFLKANAIYEALPEKEKDAFFELVLMKIHASYYTNAMYYFSDRSKKCADMGRGHASREYVALSKGFEDMRRKMLFYYNKEMQGGKWDGIVTPEDFPPPRTSMHPASKAALALEEPEEPDRQFEVRGTATGIPATSGVLTNAKVIKKLGRGTGDLVELGPQSTAEYVFETGRDRPVTVCIFRFPSLNSVGNIGVDVIFDGRPSYHVESPSNDEWRGNWAENIMNGCDKLYLPLSIMGRGKHTLKLVNATKYFAFSRIVIYEGKLLYDNLGAIKPGEGGYASDDLPDRSYLEEALHTFYGTGDPGKWIIPLGKYVDGQSVMDLTDDRTYAGKEKDLFMPSGTLAGEDLLDMGMFPAKEKDGSIVIEAFGAYNDTVNAYHTGNDWDYSTGVSYDRTNQAMYIRERGLYYDDCNAPSLHYKIMADGGRYTVYVLMKINARDSAGVGIALDGKSVDIPWDDHSSWRYEAEQIFRYVPLTVTDITPGEHELSLCVYASTIRIERIILRKK